MSNVYFGSDWHLGHKNIHTFGCRTWCDTLDKNYQFIGDNYPLKKKTEQIYLLGDICFEPRALEFLRSLPGQKILIGGNHDWEKVKVDMYEIAKTFIGVYGMRSYGKTKNETKCWLTHCPMHESEMQKKFYNLHGHIHEEDTNPEIRDNPKYVNVNVDVMWPKHNEVAMNFQRLMELVKKGQY